MSNSRPPAVPSAPLPRHPSRACPWAVAAARPSGTAQRLRVCSLTGKSSFGLAATAETVENPTDVRSRSETGAGPVVYVGNQVAHSLHHRGREVFRVSCSTAPLGILPGPQHELPTTILALQLVVVPST